MIKVYKWGEVSPEEIFARVNPTSSVEAVVSGIIAEVIKNKDEALRAYAEKFDGVKLDGLEVAQTEIDAAYQNADSEFVATIEEAAANIRAFHARQVREGFKIERPDGTVVGQKVTPIDRVGLYVPGGTAAYPSTVLMDAIPAKIAGCERVVMVTPPDKHGYVSLGTSVDATLAAVECADYVIAVVNKNVPRSFGDAMIPMQKIDIWCEDDTPLMEAHFTAPNEVETAIGMHCAALIEDGATLQMGIGAIPNAVLAQLGGHKNLGIHTEMFADGVLPLVEKGVINGEAKNIDKGKMVSTFLMGSQKVYDFIDDNPGVLMMDVGYTNDPYIIAKNDRVTAINSALQVDLTGQVCADSLGTKFWSGVGGQVDFVYGASLSKGGKAIIAMPSITNKGVSKICPTLLDGAGVVTTRNHIHWFVTEFGAVDLYGKTLQERARLLISIAHPSAQEELDKAAFERWGSHHHYIKSYMKK